MGGDKRDGVFPTSVGMNRGENKSREVNKSVPHKRGDEPMKKGSAPFYKI